MFKYMSIVVLMFQTFSFANGSVYNLNSDEARETKQLLERQKGVLISTGGNNFIYKRVKSVNIKQEYIASTSDDKVLNMFNKINQGSKSSYHIKLNNQKVDLTSTYIRDSNNKNKWLKLGAIIDPSTFKGYLNDVYYVYTEKEVIPLKIQDKIKPTSGTVLSESADDAEFNRQQQGKVYEDFEEVGRRDLFN